MNILPPTNCPACNAVLVWRNDILYCVNELCTAKVDKQIEHWARTLKIKGLGSQTIAKLKLESFIDIYALTEEQIINAIGSEKLAKKLIVEINSSKQLNMSDYLAAFGIPLVGKTIASKLSEVISSLDEISETALKQAGIGQKASANIMSWYTNEYIPFLKEEMPFISTQRKSNLKTKSEIKGVVCITGKLKSFKTKSDAKKALEAAGYIVKDSLTKDVTILLNESAVSTAKTQKAEQNGVSVITNINHILGE